MCPTIVVDKSNQLVMALGAAGGQRIPAAVAQILLRIHSSFYEF